MPTKRFCDGHCPTYSSLRYQLAFINESARNQKTTKVLCSNTNRSVHATIEEKTIYPTPEQAIKCLIICQMLSNLYQDIRLFRFDETTRDVFILAGTSDELEIIVAPNGFWRFLDETEFS